VYYIYAIHMYVDCMYICGCIVDVDNNNNNMMVMLEGTRTRRSHQPCNGLGHRGYSFFPFFIFFISI
jgi:hypothetical protein